MALLTALVAIFMLGVVAGSGAGAADGRNARGPGLGDHGRGPGAADPGDPGRAEALPRRPAAALKLKDWAKQQVSADKQRRKNPRAVKPISGLKIKAKPRGPAARTVDETSALVLYDTAGPYGFLGELYAMATANLAGRFGAVTTKPVSQYTAGMVEQHTATIYIGSTYYGGSIPDDVPDAFYSDVVTTAKPVIWMNDNIWTLANKVGISNFTTKYGWDPTNSYFGSGNVTQVDYKTQPLTRTIPAGGDNGVLQPYVTNPSLVTSLAVANDTSTTPAMTFPWALRSSNLTYLGEIPYSYVNETDRIIAWHDLLFDALAPNTPTQHRAILRLEDISPNSDPGELMNIATYLDGQNIPYAFQVIPVYTDPNGVYNDGTPETVTLAQRPQVVAALNYMLAHGGRIVAHGYTHQYSNVNNPYNGVSGDDFEFFTSHIDANDYVIFDGPAPVDSEPWAAGRLTAGKAAYGSVGLPVPTIWTTPHYAASALDYGVIKQEYAARLERSLFFSGQLSGGPIDGQRFIGQFFPYPVRDINGATVLPENLGNYEPEAMNHHPARFPADIVRAARYNLAVRDGFASTFYHPYFPVGPLSEIVDGIRDLGYTFVDPATLIP
ncbi:DUF2334 domain-containing protein [Spirillospora sp. NPDC048911]|uniref:DUF2334 domain-containing protein n=1 Tax=Spirillospora sp. NPDC048911 TaxID=3364527 RepID=UPI0037189F05